MDPCSWKPGVKGSHPPSVLLLGAEHSWCWMWGFFQPKPSRQQNKGHHPWIAHWGGWAHGHRPAAQLWTTRTLLCQAPRYSWEKFMANQTQVCTKHKIKFCFEIYIQKVIYLYIYICAHIAYCCEDLKTNLCSFWSEMQIWCRKDQQWFSERTYICLCVLKTEIGSETSWLEQYN